LRAEFALFGSQRVGTGKAEEPEQATEKRLIRGLDVFWGRLSHWSSLTIDDLTSRFILGFSRFDFRCSEGGIKGVSSAIDKPI
jgi:DMSO/TMAO reductase YedYZ molybdopterin-dependent catalytic subunit